MSLHSPPDRGFIIIVNFELGGTLGAEMTGTMRPCVVVQNNRLHRGPLVTVVPISTTAPEPAMPWHHELDHMSFRAWPISWGGQGLPRWAKCDYITTVSLERCEHPYSKTRDGGRRYTRVRITRTDLEAVEGCVQWALGIQAPEPGV
jgi:uncharacterized protein YifN (PemK superfamily)